VQNIYWVYGIITVIDGISFAIMYALYDDNKKKHFALVMTPRFRNGLIAMGLWLVSIPVVVISYYLPVIAISLLDIANLFWMISLTLSGGYDTLYVMIIVGGWLSKGMELE
jgi:hypothetical protein